MRVLNICRCPGGGLGGGSRGSMPGSVRGVAKSGAQMPGSQEPRHGVLIMMMGGSRPQLIGPEGGEGLAKHGMEGRQKVPPVPRPRGEQAGPCRGWVCWVVGGENLGWGARAEAGEPRLWFDIVPESTREPLRDIGYRTRTRSGRGPSGPPGGAQSWVPGCALQPRAGPGCAQRFCPCAEPAGERRPLCVVSELVWVACLPRLEAPPLSAEILHPLL